MKTYEQLIEEMILNEGVYDKGIFKAFYLAGGPGCFAPETPVWTPSGYVRIDELKEGDDVYTLSDNNEVVTSKVTDLLKNTVHGITEVTMEDGTKVLCSVDHPFRLSDGSWKEASQLEEGDDLWEETSGGTQ